MQIKQERVKIKTMAQNKVKQINLSLSLFFFYKKKNSNQCFFFKSQNILSKNYFFLKEKICFYYFHISFAPKVNETVRTRFDLAPEREWIQAHVAQTMNL